MYAYMIVMNVCVYQSFMNVCIKGLLNVISDTKCDELVISVKIMKLINE